MSDRQDPEYEDQGFCAPVNAAEAAIFEMYSSHRTVPVEQRKSVRAQLNNLAAQDGVRMSYEILAGTTRKRIKRLGKS